VLRFSIVNPLISNDDGVLPYLQYLITTNGTANLPFQESIFQLNENRIDLKKIWK